MTLNKTCKSALDEKDRVNLTERNSGKLGSQVAEVTAKELGIKENSLKYDADEIQIIRDVSSFCNNWDECREWLRKIKKDSDGAELTFSEKREVEESLSCLAKLKNLIFKKQMTKMICKRVGY